MIGSNGTKNIGRRTGVAIVGRIANFGTYCIGFKKMLEAEGECFEYAILNSAFEKKWGEKNEREWKCSVNGEPVSIIEVKNVCYTDKYNLTLKFLPFRDNSWWVEIWHGNKMLKDRYDGVRGLVKFVNIENLDSYWYGLLYIVGKNDVKQKIDDKPIDFKQLDKSFSEKWEKREYTCADVMGNSIDVAELSDWSKVHTISLSPFSYEYYDAESGCKQLEIKYIIRKNPGLETWRVTLCIDGVETEDRYVIQRVFAFNTKKEAEDPNVGFLACLAKTAMPEPWGFGEKEPYSILKSYLRNTYSRLLELNKDKGEYVKAWKNEQYINTGLLDHYFNEIYICGTTDPGDSDMLHSLRIVPGTKLAGLFQDHELPKMAVYFTDAEQTVFDANLKIELNRKHIDLRIDRLQKYESQYEEFKDKPDEWKNFIQNIAIRDIGFAIDRAKKMAQRNYRLAVPQFAGNLKKLQFLLPIYLTEEISGNWLPQGALVLDFVKGEKYDYYEGKTVLTLEMAYNNARLIVKPDVFWLEDMFKKNI